MADRGGPVASAPDAGCYYDPYRGRAVLAFVPPDRRLDPMPSRVALEEYGTCRRIVADSASDDELPLVRSALSEIAPQIPSEGLLHPYDRASVADVVRNWRRALEGETTPASPHNEYIGLEVADFHPLFLGFMRPEILLWRSLAELTGDAGAERRVDALHEALDIGTYVTTHIDRRIQERRGTSALVLNALCDLARHAMVYEKRLGLQSLEGTLGGAQG